LVKCLEQASKKDNQSIIGALYDECFDANAMRMGFASLEEKK